MKIIYSILLLSIIFASEVSASVSMSASECPFTGIVQDVQLRKEPGRGISKGETLKYIDITVLITEGYVLEHTEMMIGCNIPAGKESVFQMHGGILGTYDPSLPKIGSCIQASSRYQGDGNFMSGDWLTINNTLPATECEKQQKPSE